MLNYNVLISLPGQDCLPLIFWFLIGAWRELRGELGVWHDSARRAQGECRTAVPIVIRMPLPPYVLIIHIHLTEVSLSLWWICCLSPVSFNHMLDKCCPLLPLCLRPSSLLSPSPLSDPYSMSHWWLMTLHHPQAQSALIKIINSYYIHT